MSLLDQQTFRSDNVFNNIAEIGVNCAYLLTLKLERECRAYAMKPQGFVVFCMHFAVISFKDCCHSSRSCSTN